MLALGGSGPLPLLLLHANGFAGAMYVPLVAAPGGLGAVFTVYGVDAPGQGASPPRAAPGTPGALAAYPALALAAVDWLRERGRIASGAPVYAFGHSGGGLTAVQAALDRPGVFAALYLYEPVLLPPNQPGGLSSTPLLVAGARRRRRSFPSRDAARAALAAKPPMASFDGVVLDAYVAHCLVEEAGVKGDGSSSSSSSPSVRLAASPDDEGAVYLEAADLGVRAWRGLATLTAPVTVAAGGDGGPLARVAPAIAAALPRGRAETFAELSHLGPFEAPAAVAVRAVAGLTGAVAGLTGAVSKL